MKGLVEYDVRWIICAHEPVPAPATPSLELRRKLIAGVGRRAAVARLAPDLGRGVPFGGAAIVDAVSTARNLKRGELVRQSNDFGTRGKPFFRKK